MGGVRAFSKAEAGRLLAAGTDRRFVLRNRCLVAMGLYTGARASELSGLRLRGVLKDGKMLDRVYFDRHTMKGKRVGRDVAMHPELKLHLKAWIQELFSLGYVGPDMFLFQSQKGGNSPITPQHVWFIINQAAQEAGIVGKIGAHSMRKFYGSTIYEMFKSLRADGKPVADPLRAASKALGHKRLDSTEHYLPNEQDEVDSVIRAMTVAA